MGEKMGIQAKVPIRGQNWQDFVCLITVTGNAEQRSRTENELILGTILCYHTTVIYIMTFLQYKCFSHQQLLQMATVGMRILMSLRRENSFIEGKKWRD